MQEIIVYRNPAEAALYHALSDNEFVFPIMVAVAAFLVVFVFCHGQLNQMYRRRGRTKLSPKFPDYLSFAIGVAAAVGVFMAMKL